MLLAGSFQGLGWGIGLEILQDLPCWRAQGQQQARTPHNLTFLAGHLVKKQVTESLGHPHPRHSRESPLHGDNGRS